MWITKCKSKLINIRVNWIFKINKILETNRQKDEQIKIQKENRCTKPKMEYIALIKLGYYNIYIHVSYKTADTSFKR